MKYGPCFIPLFLLLISLKFAIAQGSKNNPDLIYGLDAQLINGKEYHIVKQNNIIGHQFLFGEEFTKGTVKIKGVIYTCNRLNYDIYNQKLLLQYTHPNGSDKIIAISDAWLQEFTLDNIHFLVNQTKNKNIYQAIGTDSLQVHYYWKKKLTLNNRTGDKNYYYSMPEKDSYILLNENMVKYTNNRSFLSAFEPNKQASIKKYLRENKIKVKKAHDQIMRSFILFYNNLN